MNTVPIIYKVDRTRDGHTFSTRQVSAIQKGRVIFTMYASFQVGYQFQFLKYVIVEGNYDPDLKRQSR